MAKMKNSLVNMVLSLTIISLVAAAVLAGVYTMTADTIEASKLAKKEAAKAAVLAGNAEGVAVETEVDGFGGKVRLMFGFAPDGTILGYEVLEQAETPGLGTHIVEWFKNADKPGQNIIGRKANGNFTVSKDGGDVDAITAATISSRAFLKGLNQAYADFAGVEAASGATTQWEPEGEAHECCGKCEGEGHEGHECCGKCEGHEVECCNKEK